MPAKAGKLSLFIFIDALGWEIMRDRPFLNDLLTVKRPLDTVFGYSSSCDPTILTGKMPQVHGHFSFFLYDPPRSPFGHVRWLRHLPKSVTSRGRVRGWISRAVEKTLDYTGYFQLYNMPFEHLPLFDYSEKRDLYKPGGINGGQETVFDELIARNIPFHATNWRLPEPMRLEAFEAELPKREMRMAYLFLSDIDGVLHRVGTQHAEVDEKLAWYERRLTETLNHAYDHYDEIDLCVFSDHGMTDTVEDCDLMSRIDALGLTFGEDYAAVYDSTMARFWFLRDSARDKIERALAQETRGRILTPDQLEAYGCNFPGQRYGELYFLLDPGVLLCPSFMSSRTLAGMHGFDPHHKDSIATFMSNRSFEAMPTRLDDMRGLMEESLALNPSEPVSAGA